jgi:hypothetical protein
MCRVNFGHFCHHLWYKSRSKENFNMQLRISQCVPDERLRCYSYQNFQMSRDQHDAFPNFVFFFLFAVD